MISLSYISLLVSPAAAAAGLRPTLVMFKIISVGFPRPELSQLEHLLDLLSPTAKGTPATVNRFGYIAVDDN